MKKLFIDTNIVLDLLAQRGSFYWHSAILFSLADKEKLKIYVSALTIANTSYILSKHMPASEVKEILRKLNIVVNVLPLDYKIIELALNDKSFVDFEDSLQYFTAIENGIDIIITRNLKDFVNSKIPVMSAEEYPKTMDFS
jgi:predicted nucleic acid-binding protein